LRPAVLDGGGSPRSTGILPVPRTRADIGAQNILKIAVRSFASRRNYHAPPLWVSPSSSRRWPHGFGI